MTEYKFFLSSDVNLTVKLKIASLDGNRPRRALTDVLDGIDLNEPPLYGWDWDPNDTPQSDLHVTAELWSDDKSLGLPSYTTYKTFTSQCRWNEWISLPIKYRDLPRNAQISFTVWDAYAPRQAVAVGGTTIQLFNDKGVLIKGLHRLVLHPGKEGDGKNNTTTPGQIPATDELGRLENLICEYDRGEMHRVPWLDKLVFQQIERINQEQSLPADRMNLLVEFPSFEHPVLYHEQDCNPPVPPSAVAGTGFVVVYDPESARENPVELKHRKLARSMRRGVADKELKPNPSERRQIATVLSHPPTKHLSAEEKDLMWKFRYSLVREKKALTKFLKCVDWGDAQEAKQAVSLLAKWVPIDIDDALELLSASFTSDAVREYAVSRLKTADDDEIMSYLLQLVNALRYERAGDRSMLADFLIERAIRNPELGNFFHWYLTVAMEDKAFTSLFLKVYDGYSLKLLDVPYGTARLEMYAEQAKIVALLSNAVKEIRARSEPRPKKIQYLRKELSSQGQLRLETFAPMRLPLDPRVQICGIDPNKASIFKSALTPFLLSFKTDPPGPGYRVIFKSGDDLRQDQLVISMFALMDRLLRKESLDLKIIPYGVLATSRTDGMVEFVETSKPLAAVLAGSDILSFLSEKHAAPDRPLGIQPDVLDTYLRSCAGYSVLTYILGVGDRHLDNLLITESGNLFHIDFGFLLGRDPKPLPPPMKLCKEMVEAMGGVDSPHYQQFKSYCCEAYNILRKSANLILNLLGLMVDASIPDLSAEPDKAILKVQEKFRLDLSDEEAVQYFQGLINEAVSALFPQMVETIHRWAQYWRS